VRRRWLHDGELRARGSEPKRRICPDGRLDGRFDRYGRPRMLQSETSAGQNPSPKSRIEAVIRVHSVESGDNSVDPDSIRCDELLPTDERVGRGGFAFPVPRSCDRFTAAPFSLTVVGQLRSFTPFGSVPTSRSGPFLSARLCLSDLEVCLKFAVNRHQCVH